MLDVSQRIAKKHKDILDSIKNRNASVTYDKDGHRSVKKLAPNTDRKKVRCDILGTRFCYCCPRCGKPLEYHKKMHKNLCMRCGQYLDWHDYENMGCVWIKTMNPDEANYWTRQYEYFNSTVCEIDIDQLHFNKKEYPLLLYFAFPNNKDYGRFMRKAAKEATIIKSF